MNHTTRRTGYSSLLAGLFAVGFGLTLSGCKTTPGLLSTRNGMVPPPYESPSGQASLIMGMPAPTPSPEPFPPVGAVVTDLPSDLPGPGAAVAPEPPAEAPKGFDMPAAPKVEQLKHTVAKNESLWLIAQKYGITYQELAAANSLDPNAVIYPGKVLTIPPGGRPGAAGEGRAPTIRGAIDDGKKGAAGPATGAVTTYEVQRGDCLSKIAARCNMKTAELRQLNGMKTDNIFPGQKLKIRGTVSGTSSLTPSKPKEETKKPVEPTPGPVEPAPTAPTEATGPAAGTTDIPPVEEKATDATKPATGDATVDETGKEVGTIEVAPAPAANLRKLPHDVCKDDTLENVAEMYGTTVQSILQANPALKSNADLKVGMTIMVPYK